MGASARVVDVEAHGCESHRTDTSTLPTGQTALTLAERTTLVPGTPSSVATCAYDGGGLVVGTDLVGSDARRLAAVLNAAPRGGSRNVAERDCAGLNDAPSYLLTFGYPVGPAVSVWVRITGCGILGASNGSVVHQRTDALIANVTSASGLWGTSWTGAVVPTAD
jgi:hypothetical protein